jgi:hypothetical protein
MSSTQSLLKPALTDGGSGPISGPASAPSQGDALVGSAGGGFELAPYGTYTVTGDGDTIPVSGERVLQAEAHLTDAEEAWTVSLGAGSYAGQQLVLALQVTAEATMSITNLTVTIDTLGEQLRVDGGTPGTNTDTRAWALTWDGSRWGYPKPGVNRDGATITGLNANAEGIDTTASAEAAHAEGDGTTASDFRAHAEGADTVAMGGASHAEGDGTIAIGGRSHAGGLDAEAYENYQFARAGGSFSVRGDAQHTITPMRTLNDNTSMYMDVPEDKVLFCFIQIVAAEAGMGDAASFARQCCVKNDGGTTSMVGSVQTIGTDQDPGAIGYGVSIVADDTSDYLRINPSGSTGNTRWFAVVYAAEVSNP